MRFFLRRLGHVVFLLLGVSALSFAFLALAPGSFLDEMRLNPQISPETVAALRAEYGLDQPLFVRYARWLRSVARGDLGYSFAYNQPAARLLLQRARNTLVLTVTAFMLAWILALPIGIWSAEARGRWPDRVLSACTGALLALPDLLLALGLLLLAVRMRSIPIGGMISVDSDALSFFGKLRDLARHMLLPVAALVLGTLPVLVRHVRAAVAEALQAPFYIAAVGHGIPRRRRLLHHALPAAANSLISLLGFSFGALLSGSLLVEVVMSWPGLGPLLLEAILARDLYLVIGAVMFSTVFLVAGGLLADLLLYWNDPRIRVQERQA